MLSVPLSRIIEILCASYEIEPSMLSQRGSRHPARVALGPISDSAALSIVWRAVLRVLVPRTTNESVCLSVLFPRRRSIGEQRSGFLFPARRMSLFVSLSCSREDDRLVGKRLFRVSIAPEENATNILPGLPPGSCRSRGHPPRYSQTQPSAQSAATPPADLLSQRMRAQVPAAALEPALLPGPGMPAASPPLAGGSPPG